MISFQNYASWWISTLNSKHINNPLFLLMSSNSSVKLITSQHILESSISRCCEESLWLTTPFSVVYVPRTQSFTGLHHHAEHCFHKTPGSMCYFTEIFFSTCIYGRGVSTKHRRSIQLTATNARSEQIKTYLARDLGLSLDCKLKVVKRMSSSYADFLYYLLSRF